jgi:hypothetical protein
MSTENKSEYLLLFRGINWDKDLSPEEIQTVMSEFMNWLDCLGREGKLKAGQPLANTGKVVSGPKGRTVADGPFAESKEAIGGYFLLEVADMDEAVAIAQQCPILRYGPMLEVRPVAEQCSTMQRANEFARATT